MAYLTDNHNAYNNIQIGSYESLKGLATFKAFPYIYIIYYFSKFVNSWWVVLSEHFDKTKYSAEDYDHPKDKG